MSKAIVMSLKGQRAVVLAQGGRFVMVPREKHYQVGDEIEFEAEEGRSLPRTATRKRVRWVAGAGTTAVLCLLLFGGLWLRTPPVVAYVTMDVNPSVELGIDGKDRVRELRAVNSDAIPVIEGIDYKGENIETVADQLVDKLASLNLLEGEDSEIVLTTVPVGKVDEDWESEVQAIIKHSIEEAGASAGAEEPGTSETSETSETAKTVPVVTTVSVPKEVREQANAKGISAGKMAFWLKAESQGHRVPIQKLKQESMKEISSSWGGVGTVLEESEDKDKQESSEEWKALVAKAKEKDQKREEARQKREEAKQKREEDKQKREEAKKSNKDKESGKPAEDKSSGTSTAGDKGKQPETDLPSSSPSASGGNVSVANKGAKTWTVPNVDKSEVDKNDGDSTKNSSKGNRWGRADEEEKNQTGNKNNTKNDQSQTGNADKGDKASDKNEDKNTNNNKNNSNNNKNNGNNNKNNNGNKYQTSRGENNR